MRFTKTELDQMSENFKCEMPEPKDSDVKRILKMIKENREKRDRGEKENEADQL